MSFASTLTSTLAFPSMFAVPVDPPTPTPTVDERVAEVIKHAEHLLAAGELFIKTNPPCGHGPRQPTPYDAWINDVLETSALAIVAHFDAEPRLRLRVPFCDEVLGYFYNVAHKARRRQQELQRKASRDPRKRLPTHNNNTATPTTTDGGVARTARRAPPAAAHPYQRPVRASRQPEVLPAPAPVVESSAIDDLCALLGSASLSTSTSAEDPAPAPAPRPENSSREHEAYLPMHAGPGPMRSKPSRVAANPLDRAGRKTRLAL